MARGFGAKLFAPIRWSGRLIDIRPFGLDELQGALHRMPVAVQRAVVTKGLRNAGNIHLKAAKAAALGYSKGAEGRLDEPMMPRIAKGLKLRALRRSRKGFGVRITTPRLEELGMFAIRKHTSTFAVKAQKAFGLKLRKGYPPAHIELGTRTSQALPYLRWPFDANKERMIAAIAQSVREGIDEAVREKAGLLSLAEAGYGPLILGGRRIA